jgi:acetyltransferase-like isoleucine patch superfamily enzyme
MNNIERRNKNLAYISDHEVMDEQRKCRKILQKLNFVDRSDFEAISEIVKELLGDVDAFINPPFYCDYGKNISVGKNLFINYNCTIIDVAKVTIGDNVTSIPPYMFAYNKSLTSITIPENITSIGLHAFRECSLLQTVECLPISPPAIDYTIFSDNDANFTIYVPSESLDNYKQKWVQYADEIQAK